jgi:hypothetical protein
MKTTIVPFTPVGQRTVTLAGPQAHRLLALGQEQGWDCAVLGHAPFPDEPVRVGKWLILPAPLDTSPIPARTLTRVQAIYQTGIPLKGFVIVHEAPMALPKPKEAASGGRWPKPAGFPHLILMLSLVGKALGTLAVGFVMLLGLTTMAVPLLFLVGAAIVDPILIAVTENDEWIEIDRWWNE